MATTFTIVKPDAVAAGNAGNILAHLEKEGFRLRGVRMLRLTDAQARGFYEVHQERSFFPELVAFMTSGPVIVAALERDGEAVAHLRGVMGATDSKKATQGTVRNLYGTDIERNAIHGSDSEENAAREIAYFFAEADLRATAG
jgi:nucleoside-diphosphate kinase